MTTYTFTRVHQTRFYLVSSVAERFAAVVDDFGNLVHVDLEAQQ